MVAARRRGPDHLVERDLSMSHVSALPIRRGLGFVLFAAVAWGTGGAMGAFLQRGGALGPLAVAFWRLAIAAVIVVAVTRTAARMDRRTLAIGPLMAINQGAYFAAIANSGVAFATMVTMGVMPVLAVLAARVFLRERLTRHAMAGVALAIVGVILMADLADAASLAGAGFAVLSATAYAGMTVITKVSFHKSALAGRFAAGALCLLPVALLMGGLVPAVSALPGLAYLGAVPTALAYGLFFTGLGSVRVAT